jgi:hypothetical protein
MMQLLEMVLVKVGEEAGRPDRVRGDVQIVNVAVPVLADGGVRGGPGT